MKAVAMVRKKGSKNGNGPYFVYRVSRNISKGHHMHPNQLPNIYEPFTHAGLYLNCTVVASDNPSSTIFLFYLYLVVIPTNFLANSYFLATISSNCNAVTPTSMEVDCVASVCVLPRLVFELLWRPKSARVTALIFDVLDPVMHNSTFLFLAIFCVSAFFGVSGNEDDGYPRPAIYDQTEAQCEQRCKSMLSICKQHRQGYVCEMDKTLLILIIVMAVLTGVIVPVLCISLYVCGIFAYVSHRLSKMSEDEEMLNDDTKRRTRFSNDGTMETVIREKPGRVKVDYSDYTYSETVDERPHVATSYRSMSERTSAEQVMV
uniref:G_PROTEIN_RECEP_F1_2 domain-containing protein n=1 Tax=Steinernema glaseri TaxID=37863 RepID=A0A1I8AM11_9BILA